MESHLINDNNKHIKYTQKGYLHYILMVITIIIGFQIACFEPKGNSNWILAGVLLLLIFTMISSYQLTIELTDSSLIFMAGIGIIKKTIPYESIQTTVIQSTNLWNGIGIRYLGKGWLYNIKFGKTIEIQYKNKNSVTQFGFDQAEEISTELNKRLSSIH